MHQLLNGSLKYIKQRSSLGYTSAHSDSHKDYAHDWSGTTADIYGVKFYSGHNACRCCAVVVEATYGVSRHLPRDQREQRFIEKVRGILMRGGRVLLPVVALGRAQVHSHSPWQPGLCSS